MPERNSAIGKMSNESFIVLSMFGVLVLFFIAASLFVPRFFNIHTISNQLSQQAELIILAIFVTFLLVSGNFDLSVGGIVGLGAVLSAYFCQSPTGAGMELARGLGMPYGVAIVATLACCMFIGAINAFFVTRWKVASIIVTLGTMSLARGIALIITQGSQRNAGLPYVFKKFGEFSLIGTINASVVLMIIIVIIALIIEKKTVFGRRTYYIFRSFTCQVHFWPDWSGSSWAPFTMRVFPASARDLNLTPWSSPCWAEPAAGSARSCAQSSAHLSSASCRHR